MRTNIEELVLSLKLTDKGIFPELRNNMINNYQIIKKTLKKIGINTTVNVINKIAVLILYRTFDEMIRDPKLKQEIEEILCAKIDSEQLKYILEILISEMPLFNQSPQNLLESQHDQYNHPILQSQTVQKALGNLPIKTVLSIEKYDFIVISWFNYMTYAQDLEAKNNEVTEKIKELKLYIKAKIQAIKTFLNTSQHIIEQIKSMERFLNFDIEYEEKSISFYESQLYYYNQLLNKLSLRRGSPFSIHEIKKYAYYAMVFCALSLGLEPPSEGDNFYGNPIIDFLKIIEGLDTFLESNSATCRASKNYNHFCKWLVKDTTAKAHVDALLDLINQNPNCNATWETANKIFQSLLPTIIARPRFPITRQVATHEEKVDV
jgi:hypothetical protein